MKDRFGSVAVLWGIFLALLTALGLIAFDVDVETPALLGGAALRMLIAGAALVLGRPPLVAVEVAPEVSPPTAWLAISLALLAVSAVLGFWLTLIAAGMCGAGIGGIIRERRAERGIEESAGGRR
jgi:hypothetical protein